MTWPWIPDVVQMQCSLLWAGPVNHVSCVLTEIRMFAVASSSGSVIVTRDHDTNVEVDTCYMWWRDVDWHRHNNLVVLTWGKTWDEERCEHHLAEHNTDVMKRNVITRWNRDSDTGSEDQANAFKHFLSWIFTITVYNICMCKASILPAKNLMRNKRRDAK